MFRNFTIRFKLILLGASTVIMFAAQLILSVSIETSNHKLASFLDANQSIEINLLRLSQLEKDFLKHPGLTQVKQYDKIYKGITKEMNILRQASAEYGIPLKNIEMAIRLTTQFKTSFHQYVDVSTKIGFTEKLGLRGKLRDSVHTAESIINNVEDYKLLSDMLMLRRAEKDFMLRFNLKYVKKFEKSYGVMLSHIESSNLTGQKKQQVNDLVRDYRLNFLKMIAGYKLRGLDEKSGYLGDVIASASGALKHLEQHSLLFHEFTEKKFNERHNLLLVVTLLMVVVAVLMLYKLTQSILVPLKQVTDAFEKISSGEANYKNKLEVFGKDELGDLSTNFNTFTSTLGKIIEVILGNAESMAGVIRNVDKERSLIEESEKSMTSSADVTTESIGQVRSSTEVVASASEQSSSNMKSLSISMGDLTGAISTIAAAAEEANVNMASVNERGVQVAQTLEGKVSKGAIELTSALKEINEKTLSALKISEEASNNAAENQSAMASLSDAANEISQIIQLVNSIASQTNMLALNATIEAASAGAAGKGFAVVAGEVKHLSQQTTEANRKIGQVINLIQELVQKSSGRAAQVVSVIEKLSQFNREISELVQQQSHQSVELTKNVAEISEAVHQSSLNIGEASEGIKEITRSTGHVSMQSTEMNRNIQESAVGIEEVARSVSEISSGIDKIHDCNSRNLSAIDENSTIQGRVFNYFKSLSKLSTAQDQAISQLSSTDSTLFYWNDELATGNADLDRQHEDVVDQFNNVYQAIEQGPEACSKAMTGLIDSMASHCKDEENLFLKTEYKNGEKHKRIHQNFVEQLKGMRTASGQSNFGGQLAMIKDEIQTHFLVEDKEYIPFL